MLIGGVRDSVRGCVSFMATCCVVTHPYRTFYTACQDTPFGVERNELRSFER